MRLLYIAPLNSVHTNRWVRFFANQGHEVHILDISNLDNSEENLNHQNVHIHQIALPFFTIPIIKYFTRFPIFIWKVKKLIKKIVPDVIHIHWLGLYSVAIPFTGFRPVMVTPWGTDLLILPKESRKRRWMVNRVVRSADHFCCDAVHLKDELANYGANPDKVDIIYFGVDTDKFHPVKKNHDVAKKLGFSDDAPLVVSLRGLAPVYDLETFIRMIPLVHQQNPETRFVVVGDGPQREFLENLAIELEVDQFVTFVGRVSEEDLVLYTASADIYVSTSLSDGGLAASTGEAMACAVPVVISDFGENSDWVEKGEAGMLFPLKDAKCLADNIISLLSDPDLAKRLGERGREVILERNSYKGEMKKVEDIYYKLAEKG
jgi:L-malate glycosyltransferase